MLISVMLKSFGGGDSLYRQWDMPIGVYIITILAILILIILDFSLLFNPEGHKSIHIDNNEIKMVSAIGQSTLIQESPIEVNQRFDIWSKNDANDRVVEIKFEKRESILILVQKKMFDNLVKEVIQ